MMTNRTLFGDGRFGRADIQSTVNLHGIDRNDFGVEFPGEKKRDCGFTGSSWTSQVNGVLEAHPEFELNERGTEAQAPSLARLFWPCISCRQERMKSSPTPVQMAVSAILKAGKPISRPSRGCRKK